MIEADIEKEEEEEEKEENVGDRRHGPWWWERKLKIGDKTILENSLLTLIKPNMQD